MRDKNHAHTNNL